MNLPIQPKQNKPRTAPLFKTRNANTYELAAIPWLMQLNELDRNWIKQHILVTNVSALDYVCRYGRPATYWFGLIDGLLKMSNDEQQNVAHPITFSGVAPGGWFGEGTVLKGEHYRYNIQALRQSTIAGITVQNFHHLLDNSFEFNRFIMHQLNERVSQFIIAREIDRYNDATVRVARTVANLFHPVLCPSVGQTLRITQQELAYLVGISRQRANIALQTLNNTGYIRIEYGGLQVINLEKLRNFKV